MDFYASLKALHIAAVMIWLGGLFLTAITYTALTRDLVSAPIGTGSPILEAVRNWDRFVTTPSMIMVWGLGLALAVSGHWFPAPWLLLKLGVVLGLTALHGMLTGRLRRVESPRARFDSSLSWFGPKAIIVGVLLIVILAVVKPF